MGALALAPAIAWAIDPDQERLGWPVTATVLGIFMILVAFPISRLIRDRPQDVGLLPQGQPGEPKGKGGPAPDSGSLFGRDATFREAVRTPLFQMLTIGYFV